MWRTLWDDSSNSLVVSNLLRCCFVMQCLFQHIHLSCTAMLAAITRSLNILQYMTYHLGIYSDQGYRSVKHGPLRLQLMADGQLFWQCLYQQAYWSKPRAIFKRCVTSYNSFDNPKTIGQRTITCEILMQKNTLSHASQFVLLKYKVLLWLLYNILTT